MTTVFIICMVLMCLVFTICTVKMRNYYKGITLDRLCKDPTASTKIELLARTLLRDHNGYDGIITFVTDGENCLPYISNTDFSRIAKNKPEYLIFATVVADAKDVKKEPDNHVETR